MATRADEVVIDDMSTGFATRPQPEVAPVEPVAVETPQPEEQTPQVAAAPTPSPNIETDTPSTPTPVPEEPVAPQDGYNFFPYETAADVVYPKVEMGAERDPELDPKQMFPSMFYELEEQGKFEGDESKRQAFRASVADNYRNFLNFANKPAREEAIMAGSAFAYGVIDEKTGKPVISEDGIPEFSLIRGFTASDIDGRLIELVEANKADGNPSLQYYIIDPDDGRPLIERVKRFNVRSEYYGVDEQAGMLTDKQPKYIRSLVRLQDEDGGMKFFDETLKSAKIPIEQRIPLLRNEATKGFAAPIQIIRNGIRPVWDTIGAVGQGLSALDSVAYNFTAKVPFDIIQAGYNLIALGDSPGALLGGPLNAPRVFGKMGEAIVEGVGEDSASYEFGGVGTRNVGPVLNQPEQSITQVTGIPTLKEVEEKGSRELISALQKKLIGTDAALTEMPMVYASGADFYASETSLTKEQIDVILAYNEDFLTTLMEFGMESLIFGGAINGAMLHMSAGVVEDFANFAVRKYGGKEFPTKVPTFRTDGKKFFDGTISEEFARAQAAASAGKKKPTVLGALTLEKAKVADQRGWI